MVKINVVKVKKNVYNKNMSPRGENETSGTPMIQ